LLACIIQKKQKLLALGEGKNVKHRVNPNYPVNSNPAIAKRESLLLW